MALRSRADEYQDRLRPGHCACHLGKGTYAYLRAPFAGPNDPPPCGLALAGGNCGLQPRPPGSSMACWNSRDEACFWKRHARSWQIRCSECWAGGDCPLCDDEIGGRDPAVREMLEARVKAEAPLGLGPIVVAVSPHFYVVTNLEKRMKLRTRRGALRLMSAHEVAHLYLQRAEIAYDDFVHWFGGPVILPKPMAIYLVDRHHEFMTVSDRYFGGNGTHMNYAFNYGDRIAQGFCGNGFVATLERLGGDLEMHGYVRHQIGHILFSCWIETNGFEDHCPRWAWIGAAHFLAKLQEQHDEYATFCYGESAGGQGSGKRWPKRVRDMARHDMPPIETFFSKTSLSDFDFKDHLRAWSVMDLMLREDRDRWLALLKILRAGGDEGTAFKEALDILPEQFQERWVERVLGKRRSMGVDRPEPEETPGDPSRRERELIRDTGDPGILAGRIRGLDKVQDVKMADVVLERLVGATDLVRETIHHVLLHTSDPAVLAYLREEGLHHPEADVRAAVCRALGARKDEESRPVLETLLEDPNWLVRASAAEALHGLGAAPSEAVLLGALDEEDPRAWILVADAYASIGKPSKAATLRILPHLEHKWWQVRLLACQALTHVGTEEAMDALVERFAYEDGRLRRELLTALRAVSHDDLGENPETWRRWWKDQKKEYGGLGPQPEKDAVQSSKDRYANLEDKTVDKPNPNDYWGKDFYSRRICYVLDISDSMKLNMEIDPSQAGALGGIPMKGRRIDIARHALLDSIRNLDPRTEFRLVFYNSTVDVWNPRMLEANLGSKASAKAVVDRIEPRGETNFHGAIKAALGLDDRGLAKLKLDEVPDTILFLTDGRPTKGEITAMPELLSWFQWVNRFTRAELHVIALGDLNIDAAPLAKLAELGHGTFVHVREVGYVGVDTTGEGGFDDGG